ncbi:MAG: cytochrome c [Polyangiaceae bacterium]
MRRVLILGCVVAVALAPACGPPGAGGPPVAAGPSTASSAAPPSPPEVATSASPTPEPKPEEDVGPVLLAPHPAADLFADLPVGEAQRQALCGRGHQDRLSKIFCASPPPTIQSLADLQKAVGLFYEKPGIAEADNVTGNGREGNPAFVFLGHSTALTSRMVSPINPRAIIFTPPAHTARSANKPPSQFVKDPEFVAMGFARGEQIVELIDRDPKTGDLRFFVVRFEQACNQRPTGCTSYELFSPAIEQSWTRVSIYDDSDLENTPADCNVCHQPNGYRTKRVLLMQAIRTPWTHFFRHNRYGGQEQLHRYAQAHSKTETYAGIPGSEVPFSDPALLEGLVENEGFMNQPVTFHAEAIAQEIEEKGLEDDPVLSIAWQLEYKRALKGDVHAVSYPVVDFMDGDRMARASKAYRAVMAGRASEDKAPYLGDMHRPDVLFRVGLAPKPDSDGRQILKNVCRRCHNPRQNPNLTRARFDVDRLMTIPVMALERARNRLVLPVGDPKRMPPGRFGHLSDEEIKRVQDELGRIIEQRGGLPDL